MNDKLQLLDGILNIRLKYVRSWGQVAVGKVNDTFTIEWSQYQGDPENTAFFQSTAYPSEMIDKVIKEQKAKLKRDIPEYERELLKSIL